MTEPQMTRCLDFFSEVLEILNSSNQYERVFHHIVDRLARIMRCQTCAIVLIDPKTEYLSIENSFGLSHTFCKSFRKKFATGPIGELLWTGRPLVVNKYDASPRQCGEIMLEHTFRSCACVQIATLHRTLGYLHVDTMEEDAFGDTELRLLQIFAGLAGVALYKNRLYDENVRLDRIDHGTGLLKYEPFVEIFRNVLDKAKETREGLSLLILDVDNYKSIVNTYGSDTAEAFLRQLGAIVTARARSMDVAGRYGRDEMIVLLPRTSIDEAIESARTLRRQVEETSFTNQGITSTISLGVAAYPAHGDTIEDIIRTAKEALFEAQRAGRNKVFHYQTNGSKKQQLLGEA